MSLLLVSLAILLSAADPSTENQVFVQLNDGQVIAGSLERFSPRALVVVRYRVGGTAVRYSVSRRNVESIRFVAKASAEPRKSMAQLAREALFSSARK